MITYGHPLPRVTGLNNWIDPMTHAHPGPHHVTALLAALAALALVLAAVLAGA